jgi:hypothetical protein
MLCCTYARARVLRTQACSYDQLTFTRANNLVIEVDVPCVGTTPFGAYNLRTGSANQANDVYALPNLAKSFVQVME